MKTYKAYEILKKYEKNNNDRLLIKTISKNITFNFRRGILAHIMGLHYYNKSNKKASIVADLVLSKKLDDEYILNKVKVNNKDKVKAVKERIENIDEFLRNIENSKLVNTKLTEKNQIESIHFLLQSKDKKYLELGLKNGIEDEYFLETFLIRNNDNNVDYSLNEEIIGFYKLDKDDRAIPFSFDEEKQKEINKNFILNYTYLNI